MAKYCGNCGAKMDDDARVCGTCGTPLGGTSGFKVNDPEKTKKLKKRIKLLLILVIIGVVAFNGVKIGLNFIGNKGFTHKVMKAYEAYDIDGLVNMSSDVYFYGDEEAAESYFEYSVGYDIDDYEESVGHNYKLSYKINEIYDLSERRQEELFDSLEYTYPDFDVTMIDKISVARVDITVKQGDKSIERSISITMTKEGKEWRLLYIE